jgi:hypothetical protein
MTNDTKTQHTPGPWSASDDGIIPVVVANLETGIGIAEVSSVLRAGPLDFREVAANARLIAAAPDLLEALRWSETILHQYWTATTTEEKNHYAADIPSALETMHKAIAKAEGRT